MKTVIALYGRRNAGKDTAARLIELALVFKAFGARKEYLTLFSHEILRQFIAEHDGELKNAFDKARSNPMYQNIAELSTFSAKIHQLTAVLTDLDINTCLDRSNKDSLIPVGFNINLRQIMVGIGEGLKTVFGENIWINPTLNLINNSKCQYVILSSFRHAAEYDALLSESFKTIFIKVVSDVQDNSGGADEAEGLLDQNNFDFTFHNKKDYFCTLWRCVLSMVYSLD